jgi:hypothetical protein
MKKGWLFKLLLLLILIISSAMLAVSVPILVKLLVSKNPATGSVWSGLNAHLTNLYFGIGIGIVVALLSMHRLEDEKQIKLVRFLLILGTMLTALSYILIKSVS